MRLLDVGCGWGSLILYAAEHYSVHATGITLSAQQRDVVADRVGGRGLADRVEMRLQDYRDVSAGPAFDAVSSIEMGEHVGEEYTTEQLRTVISRKSLAAATLYGFATGADDAIHILDPGVRMRPVDGLMVHQRIGVPLQRIQGRLTPPQSRSRARFGGVGCSRLLTRALRVRACTHAELDAAIREQKGRRGIVNVRELVKHADPRAESAMESEGRLVFIDGGVPTPELQYEIVDLCGQVWRVDFAWPDAMVVAEYDSVEWHANRAAPIHDRTKTSRLQEIGWRVVPIVVDDVHQRPFDLVARMLHQLERPRLAG
jgi:hypothetical protein